MTLPDYDKLGLFYLGREIDPESGEPVEKLLYDSRDLVTHGVIVGMTGSGKTGLAVDLVEEAALDRIPAILIDPKGDLGNLMLGFPHLSASEFEPWISADEMARQGRSRQEIAEEEARRWQDGLAEWDQQSERITRLHQAAEFTLYTPGADFGRSLSVLRSLAPPSPGDGESALAERLGDTVSALLSLAGIDADPLRDPRHLLLSALVRHCWEEGETPSPADLVRLLLDPPIDRLGALPLSDAIPLDGREGRRALANALNALVASPALSRWGRGEPLDAGRLLFTVDGRPRVSILSIAHLPEAERMFFVTLVASELLAWARRQPGTSSLRALFYMDEVFGYLPPTAEPPSKKPLLTLLKQARAWGLGCVLATQNPADLDYKGLGNAGTWFVGRLQAERDKDRLLDGLESTGGSLDRAEIDRLLSALPKRSFLLQNVHETRPVLFRTRWAMSYLRGPLTREEISRLSTPYFEAATPSRDHGPPALAADIDRWYLPAPTPPSRYRPVLLASYDVSFETENGPVERTRLMTVPFVDGAEPLAWDDACLLDLTAGDLLDEAGGQHLHHDDIPVEAQNAASYRTWMREVKDFARRQEKLEIFVCPLAGLESTAVETEAEFRIRLRQVLRERRDQAIEKLRERSERRLRTLTERVQRAEDKVEKEQQDVSATRTSAAISIGATVLTALLGRKTLSRSTLGRATTAARGVSRTRREEAQVDRARERVEELTEQLEDFRRELDADIEDVRLAHDEARVELETKSVQPRASDVRVRFAALGWDPVA